VQPELDVAAIVRAAVEPVALRPAPAEPAPAEPPVPEHVVEVAEPEPHLEAAPVALAEPDVEAPATVEPTGRRSRREDRPAKERGDSGWSARPSTGDAVRDLVAEKARARARALEPVVEPAVEPVVEPAVEPAVEPVVETPVEAWVEPVPVEVPDFVEPEVAPAEEAALKKAPKKPGKHEQVATEMPGVYKFAPKRSARRLLTLWLLGGLGASAYLVRAAIEFQDTMSIGVAAIVVVATAMVWAIRAGSSMTRLEVHQGQLQVLQQGSRYVFDLPSQFTAVEVHGRPGRRGWKVVFPRRGMAPFVVDASMVDPDDFMRVLRFYRPEHAQQ
jgi:hypothetical protein